MSNGIREIISNSYGVKPVDCRTGVAEGQFVSVVFHLIECIFYDRLQHFSHFNVKF